MQPLAAPRVTRAGVSAGADYSAAEVAAALQTHRYEVFRHELHRIVAGVWTVVADATSLVHSCTIKYDRWATNFMRSASYEIVDDLGTVNFLTDVLRTFWLLRMPDGNYAQWMMGSFHVPSPKTPLRRPLIHAVDTQDSLRNLADSKITDWFQVPSAPPGGGFDAGDPIGWAMRLIADRYPLAGIAIPATALRVAAGSPKTYPPGTPVIEVVNDLLLFANYEQLRADVTGSYVSAAFIKPSDRAVEFTYTADGTSVLVRDSAMLEQDLWSAPNQWLRIVSRAETGPLRSRRTLDDPANPLSTVSRGRTVTDYAAIDAPDQGTLDEIVGRLFEEGQRVTKTLSLETPLMPHDHADKIDVAWPTQPWGAAGSGTYILRRWTFPCVAGGRMAHEYESAPITAAA